MLISIETQLVLDPLSPYGSAHDICVKRSLKNRQNKDLNDNGSLMKVESIAECSESQQYF